MDIEQQKERFLGILSALYQIEGKEEIRVSEGALLENELGGRDFWDVVCPLLKKQGVLKEFSDPDGILSEFLGYCVQHPLYKDLSDRQTQLQSSNLNSGAYYNAIDPLDLSPQTSYKKQIAEEIKRLDAEMDAAMAKMRSWYQHRFVVDGKKLLSAQKIGDAKPSQIIIHVADSGIYREIKGAPVRYKGITPTSKIFQTISYLMQNQPATLSDLARHTGQQTKVVKSSIGRFNKNAIPRLCLPKGIRLIEGNGLYQLNSQVQFV